MSASLSQLKSYNKIVSSDTLKQNYASAEHAEENKFRIGKVVNDLIQYLQSNFNPQDFELITPLIAKIKLIDKQFEKAGQGLVFATSIYTLSLIHTLRSSLDPKRQDIVKHPFIVKLKALAEAPEIEDMPAAAQKLHNFQKTILLPVMQAVQTVKELRALESLVDDCNILKKKLQSVDQNNILENLRSQMLSLWDTKLVQTNKIYADLINLQKSQIQNLNEENRVKLASKLNVYIPKFVEISDNPAVSQEDKIAIHKNLCAIYEEFTADEARKIIEPVLTNLCKALDLPFPQLKTPIATRSSNFEQLRSRFDQNASPAPLPSTKIAPVKTKNVQTPEAIRDAAFVRIQECIARLEIGNPQIQEEVKQIQSDIKKLKSLDITKGLNFSGLEQALKMLVDPNPLRISKEEIRFVELLLPENGKSKAELEKYANLEAPSILNARTLLAQTLRKNASSLENLLLAASTVQESLGEQVIKERFDRFLAVHPFPAFTRNFSTHFPKLVRNFETFTREAVLDLEKTWETRAQLYDANPVGAFSKLLKHYSYLDPRRQFSAYIKWSQKDFFNHLDLSAIDRISKEDLIPYLQQCTKSTKNFPTNFFNQKYMNVFSQKHLWLLSNINNIKIHFNQSDDIHENLGSGVCYNNSLFRFSLLQNNPQLPNEQIKMGSNPKTRYFQSKIIAYYEAAKRKEITIQAADDEQTKVSGEYGLQQFHKYKLVTPPSTDPHEYLVNEMERFAAAGHTHFILNLCSPDAGHAVNIQLDSANRMYRLFDDNIGLCQYKSINQFKKEIAKYFKDFYSDYDSYQFRLFQKT